MTATITRVAPDEMARTFSARVYEDAYRQGINVSQYLERQDPTSTYPKDSEDAQLDAFERVLRAAGIATVPVPELGIRASTWEEASDTRAKRALLPEWAARIWRATKEWTPPTPQQRAVLLSGDTGPPGSALYPWYADPRIYAKQLRPPVPLSAVITGTQMITGDALRAVYIVDDLNFDNYRMRRVAEGTEIPATTMVTGEHTIRIVKYGRALRTTYEQMRRVPFDRIAWMVARMALQTEVDKVSDAVNVLINGDGNANTSAVTLAQTTLDAGSSAGTLTLKGWTSFKLKFPPAYRANTVLAREDALKQLLLLPVLTTNQLAFAMMNPVPALGSLGTLGPIDDYLSNGIRWGLDNDAPSLKLIAFDNTQAVGQVAEAGGNVSEVERFIENQTQMLTITEVSGFRVEDVYASRILDINS